LELLSHAPCRGALPEQGRPVHGGITRKGDENRYNLQVEVEGSMLLLQLSVSVVLSNINGVLVEVKVCHAFPRNCIRFLKRVQLLETQCVRTGHPQPPSGALPANTFGAEAEEGEERVTCDSSPPLRSWM
jgi:hypothetical protein